MDENRIREIIREETAGFSFQSDRVILSKTLQILDAIDIQVGRNKGLRIGTASDQIVNIMGLKIAFAGNVDSAATSPTLPSGWTASYDSGTKQYTVTHNRGAVDYAVIAYPYNGSALPWIYLTRNANTFVALFESTAGVAAQSEWMFILIPIV